MGNAGFCWAPYGAVAAAVHGPDGGLVCIVGLPQDHTLSSIRDRLHREEDAERLADEEATLLAGRDAAVAWADRIASALNAEEGRNGEKG